jgi:hypothetical protein
VDQIREGVRMARHGELYDEALVDQALAHLLAMCLLYEERDRFLTLALPMNPHV